MWRSLQVCLSQCCQKASLHGLDISPMLLLAGVSGVTGRNLALQLEESGNWQRVYGSSRRATDFGKQAMFRSLRLRLLRRTGLVDC